MSEISSVLSVKRTLYSGYSMPKTVSDYWQMVYVENGIADITISDCVYHTESGMMAFIAPNEFVYANAYNNSRLISVIFEASGEDILGSSHKITKADEKEAFLINELMNANETDGEIETQRVNTLIQLLMLMSAKAEGISPLSKKRDASIFSKSAEILNRNISSQISVTDLAEKLGISLSHLKRIYASHTAIGVHEYHLFLKIKEAKRLLSKGATVTSTAELTGFSNQAYFSAAFKRITGVSPKTFSIKRPSEQINNQAAFKPKDLPSYLL